MNLNLDLCICKNFNMINSSIRTDILLTLFLLRFLCGGERREPELHEDGLAGVRVWQRHGAPGDVFLLLVVLLAALGDRDGSAHVGHALRRQRRLLPLPLLLGERLQADVVHPGGRGGTLLQKGHSRGVCQHRCT